MKQTIKVPREGSDTWEYKFRAADKGHSERVFAWQKGREFTTGVTLSDSSAELSRVFSGNRDHGPDLPGERWVPLVLPSGFAGWVSVEADSKTRLVVTSYGPPTEVE